MRVFVLGHRGMLGHVVARYLQSRGYDVVTSDLRYEGAPRDPLVESVRDSGCPWVINAAGRIKQKSAETSELLMVNAQLPVHLKARLRPEQRMIHASTDCVFSGRRGQYAITDESDAEDAYGFSKILGEAAAELGRCAILRTSIIGPGLKDASGLMGWFLSQDQPVNGFVNHFWNGITTLEWAKVATEVLEGKLAQISPVMQVGVVPGVSKFELLQLMARTWQHPLEIRPVQTAERLDRTMQPQIERPSLESQLLEFKEWYGAQCPGGAASAASKTPGQPSPNRA